MPTSSLSATASKFEPSNARRVAWWDGDPRMGVRGTCTKPRRSMPALALMRM